MQEVFNMVDLKTLKRVKQRMAFGAGEREVFDVAARLRNCGVEIKPNPTNVGPVQR